MLGRRLQPFREEHFAWGERVEQRQQPSRTDVVRETEISGRDIQPGGLPALLIPAKGHEVVTAARIELRILQRRPGSQDARQAAADEFARDGRLELVADGDLPARGEQPVHVGGGRMVRQAGHRGLLALGERQTQHLGGDDRVLAEDLVEIAQTEEQDGTRRELLAKLSVLTLHRGLLLHGDKGKSPAPTGARTE